MAACKGSEKEKEPVYRFNRGLHSAESEKRDFGTAAYGAVCTAVWGEGELITPFA